jgi:hypothetical protein
MKTYGGVDALRLQMEEAACSNGKQPRTHCINRHGQQTSGDPPAWGPNMELTSPHHKI